jgi:alpha-glucosidase
MTDWEPREVEIPLDFLGGGSWKAKIWADGKKADTQATEVEVSEMNVNSSGKLPIKMAPGGGLAAVFEPIK